MSTAVLAWSQFRFERRNWRNPSAAFFNFMLPLIFLVLIATVYRANGDDMDILVPGLAGMAVMTTTFTALAFNMTFLREQGILKRMRGTPVPRARSSAAWSAAVRPRADRPPDRRRPPGVRGRPAPQLADAGRLHRGRGRDVRLSRHRVRTADPELRRRTRLHQRGVPAGDLHLGRLPRPRRCRARWRSSPTCCRSST